MGDTLKLAVIILAIVVVAMLMSFFAGYTVGENTATASADTVFVHHTDTLVLSETIHDTVLQTYTKTVHVPLVVRETDTLVDSVWVSLPFEQHFARLDTVADVWYSGYDAKIDSARVYKNTITQIIREKAPEQPKNMLGATASMGDAGVFYARRLGPMWLGAAAGMTYDKQPTVRVGLGVTFR